MQQRLEPLWLLAAIAVAVVCAIIFYHTPIGSAAFFAYVGRAIVEGKLPYRDVWDNKLPSIYYLNALFRLAFGSRFVLLWAAQLAVLLVTVVLFAAFARGERIAHWGLAALALSVLLSLPPLQHFGYTEPYAVALIMAALVAIQRGACVASGVLLLLAATFWIPSTLTVLPILAYLPGRDSRTRFLLAFGAAALLYAVITLIVIGPAVAGSLLSDMRSYEGIKTGAGSTVSARGVAEHALANLRATALIVPIALTIALVRKPANRTQTFAVLWVGCAIAGACINLNFFQHYFIPSTAPLVFAISAYASTHAASLTRRVALAIAVVALIAAAPSIVTSMREGMAAEHDEAQLSDETGRALDAVLPKDARILVYGTPDGVYLTAKRDAVGRFANTFALTLTAPNRQRERHRIYLGDVRSAAAVVVALRPDDELAAVLRSAFMPLCPDVNGAEILVNRRLHIDRIASCG